MMTARTQSTSLYGDTSNRSEHRRALPMSFQVDSAETTLIRRVQNGDSDAFFDLVRPYERAVFLAALSLVRNDADAEDVAQEAILKAFKNLARFRQEAKFSTWLIQIAINEAKMRLRKDRRHLYESIEEGRLGDDGDYTPRDFADWREIPHCTDLAGRAASQHYRDCTSARSIRSEREDQTVPCPPADA